MAGKSFQIWDRQPAHESIQQPIPSMVFMRPHYHLLLVTFCYIIYVLFLFQKAL